MEMRGAGFFLCVFVSACLFSFCLGDNQTLYVSNDIGVDGGDCSSVAPCKTLNGALTQIIATNTTVVIAEGTYTGEGNVNVDISLPTNNSLYIMASESTFDCGNVTTNGFTVSNINLFIDSITMKNCGTGIYFDAPSQSQVLTMTDSDFLLCRLGVYTHDGAIHLNNVDFSGDSSDNAGIGLQTDGTNDVNLYDCSFSANARHSMTSQTSSNTAVIIVQKTIFSSTSGAYFEGPIGQGSFLGCTITNTADSIWNSAVQIASNGGLWTFNSTLISQPTKDDSVAINWTPLEATSLGSSLFVHDCNIYAFKYAIEHHAIGDVTIQHCSLAPITIAVLLYSPTTVDLQAVLFTYSSAHSVIIAPNDYTSTIAINQCNFEHAGGIVAAATLANGSLTRSVFYNSGSRPLYVAGGTWDVDSVLVAQSHVEDADGGAIHAVDSILSIRNVTVENSSSTGKGGALYAENTFLTISESIFTNNTASIGGAIAVEEVKPFSVSSTSFTSNVASTYGGAISFSGYTAANPSFSTTSFSSNHANFNGSAISCCDGQTCSGLILDFDSTVSFADNSVDSATGQEVTCTSTGLSSSTDDSSSWIIWLSIFLTLCFVACLIGAVAIGFVVYQHKRAQYDQLE